MRYAHRADCNLPSAEGPWSYNHNPTKPDWDADTYQPCVLGIYVCWWWWLFFFSFWTKKDLDRRFSFSFSIGKRVRFMMRVASLLKMCCCLWLRSKPCQRARCVGFILLYGHFLRWFFTGVPCWLNGRNSGLYIYISKPDGLFHNDEQRAV